MLPRWKTLLCWLQALLLVIPQFAVYHYGLKQKVDRAAIGLTSVNDVMFAPVEADALQVSDAERSRCRQWYDSHIRTAQNPAYDFTVGGRSLRRHLRDWEINVGEEGVPDDRGGKTTLVALRHKEFGLRARVEATIFEAEAACEWTLYIQNEGAKQSPVVRRVFVADCTLETGKTDVLFSRGSESAADDYELLRSAVPPTRLHFNATCGRTESFLPFFNLCGKSGGAVLSVGWTGQWFASLRQTIKGVHVRAGQEYFRAALEPGEEVRSPLCSLTFYIGDNALKGFNSFRQMMLHCVYPASLEPMRCYLFANEFCTLTCDELVEKVNSTPQDLLQSVDTFWMDAGWYTYQKDWYDGVGNWTPDAARFPNGLRPLADAIQARGKRFLLWYEPERVREGTILYAEGSRHDGWIVQKDDNLLWNLANDEACSFLTDYIAASLLENGVGIYRQDFNFYPLEYWHKADKAFCGGRVGITENHYVTNLYRYLDTLCERVPGLIIDNCASGGRRLDQEMCRRSVPLWRSDYNCVPADGTIPSDIAEATQAMTCGLSCWLPCSGTLQHTSSRYDLRSGILTHPMRMTDDGMDDPALEQARAFLTERYFPLTSGGTDRVKTLAMQFGTEKRGAAAVYVREEAPDAVVLRLNGLSPDRVYTVSDADDPDRCYFETGKTLMETGVTLTVKEKPAALLFFYGADTLK